MSLPFCQALLAVSHMHLWLVCVVASAICYFPGEGEKKDGGSVFAN